MMHIRPYQRLVAWKEAHALCLIVYKVTAAFPSIEKFRLTDQMCRSASSIPTNIAEGCGKRSSKERYRFYEIASCSLEELHYQSSLAKDLLYIDQATFNILERHIGRTGYLLTSMLKALRSISAK